MTRFLLTVSLALALAVTAALGIRQAESQERIDLTTPIVKTDTTDCRLDFFTVDPDLPTRANDRVLVLLLCNNGDVISKQYDGSSTPTGKTVISSLNTANFSSPNPSLIKRIYTRLMLDGVITGTVTGSPE